MSLFEGKPDSCSSRIDTTSSFPTEHSQNEPSQSIQKFQILQFWKMSPDLGSFQSRILEWIVCIWWNEGYRHRSISKILSEQNSIWAPDQLFLILSFLQFSSLPTQIRTEEIQLALDSLWDFRIRSWAFLFERSSLVSSQWNHELFLAGISRICSRFSSLTNFLVVKWGILFSSEPTTANSTRWAPKDQIR